MTNENKRNFLIFLNNIKQSGNYPDSVINNLEAHFMESTAEDIVDSIFLMEPVHVCKIMMVLLVEFSTTDIK